MDTSTDKQFATGMHAIHDWIRLNSGIELSIKGENLELPTVLVIKGGTGLDDAEAAVLIDLVTAQLLFTSGAKDAMFRAVDWKKKKSNRTTALFLPAGLLANAKEVLGLYEHYIEYK